MTLHVDNIWHSYLVFFEEKKIEILTELVHLFCSIHE